MQFGMKKKPANPTTTAATPEEIPLVSAEEFETKARKKMFKPTQEQRDFKARWWVNFNASEIESSASDLTKLEIKRVYSHPMLDVWLAEEEFKTFLFNDREQAEKLECLFGLCMDEIEDILRNRDPRYLAYKVQMIKLVSELADKMPKKTEQVQFVDKQIAAMDRKQLEEFLGKKKKAKVEEITE